MKTKTVQLNDDYYLKNGVVYVYTNDGEPVERESMYKIGAEVMLVSITDVSPNARDDRVIPKYHLEFRPDGIGGNSDPNIKRYHGWRGTTCDLSVSAHGLRKITKIRTLKNGRVAVTVGKDLLPEEK